MIKCNNFGSMSALPVSQVQIAGYAYQINYLAYLVDKLQQTVTNLDPEDQGEAISTLQAEVAELREAIQGAGGNMYVAVPSQITCAAAGKRWVLANSGRSSTTVTAMLDKDNFYYAVLNGPEASGPTPKFKIAYAIPKE